MVIAITGYARSGKDTIGEILMSKGFERVSFADPLKEMTLELLRVFLPITHAVVKEKGWDWAKENLPEARRWLQEIGSMMRASDEDYWIKEAIYKINTINDAVITDLRYKNEGIRLNEEFETYIIRVHRPGVKPANSHSSETELDQIPPDFTVINDGTIEELREKILHILAKIEK